MLSGMAAMDTKLQINQRGFTLIELLVALAILSIVMVMAIPSYKDYKTRSRISEGISLVDEVLSKVAEIYMTSGVWPENNGEAGLNEPADFATTWVSEIVVEYDADDKSQIRIVYNNATVGGVGLDDDIIFKPILRGGSTVWDCTGGRVAVYYRPGRCRNSS